MSMIQPELKILPKPQLLLWNELISTPDDFILYGGTALALRLGHRESIDFDFFSPKSFDPELLYKNISYLKNAKILQKSKNTLTCSIERQGQILISFFGGLNIRQIENPSIVKYNNLRIASLEDLAGTKTAVIQKRAEKKDYLDLYALLTLGKLSIEMLLACAEAVYGKEFNPYITLKAMSYFEEPELQSLNNKLKLMFLHLVKTVNVDLIPKLKYFPLGAHTVQ